MRWLIAAAAVLAVGCSSVKPLPVVVGDRCFGCGRPIDEVKLAGELIDHGGHALKFRSAACMAKFLAEHEGDEYRAMFITDYNTGRFIELSDAKFAKVTVNKATLEKDYLAFHDAAAAEQMARSEGGSVMAWEAVVAAAKTP